MSTAGIGQKEEKEPKDNGKEEMKLTESILAKADLSLSYTKEEYEKEAEETSEKDRKSFTESCTERGFLSCWPLRGGMPAEKEEPLSA